jgi:hypothetical protein
MIQWRGTTNIMDISALDGTEVEVIKIDKNNAWIKNE